MTLTTALKIMGMSAKALTKKYGSRAMGLSKRVKAGDMVTKAKKGGKIKRTPEEQFHYERNFGTKKDQKKAYIKEQQSKRFKRLGIKE